MVKKIIAIAIIYPTNSITIQITKNATPRAAVNRVINSSLPRSLRLANSSSFPPIILLLAEADLLLCKITMAIHKIDTIINSICILFLLALTNLSHF